MTLHLTLKMTTAQVVETSVTNNSLSKDYLHPDDHNKPITDTPGFKPFTNVLPSMSTKQYLCVACLTVAFMFAVVLFTSLLKSWILEELYEIHVGWVRVISQFSRTGVFLDLLSSQFSFIHDFDFTFSYFQLWPCPNKQAITWQRRTWFSDSCWIMIILGHSTKHLN